MAHAGRVGRRDSRVRPVMASPRAGPAARGCRLRDEISNPLNWLECSRAPRPGSRVREEEACHVTRPRAAGAPSPALVFETLFAYQRTAALRAAIELDLFRAIGEGPGDLPSLARRCSASERGIRILCDFLTINGFLSKADAKYALTPTSALFLDPRSPACVASTARFLANPMIQQPFERLAEIVRSGPQRVAGRGQRGAREPGMGGVRAQHGADDGADGRAARVDRARRRQRTGLGAGHRGRPRAVRDRGGEAAPAGAHRRRRLGRRSRGRERERAPGRRAGSLRDEAGERVRGRLRRPARHRAAHELPPPLRPADVRAAC